MSLWVAEGSGLGSCTGTRWTLEVIRTVNTGVFTGVVNTGKAGEGNLVLTWGQVVLEGEREGADLVLVLRGKQREVVSVLNRGM